MQVHLMMMLEVRFLPENHGVPVQVHFAFAREDDEARGTESRIPPMGADERGTYFCHSRYKGIVLNDPAAANFCLEQLYSD